MIVLHIARLKIDNGCRLHPDLNKLNKLLNGGISQKPRVFKHNRIGCGYIGGPMCEYVRLNMA